MGFMGGMKKKMQQAQEQTAQAAAAAQQSGLGGAGGFDTSAMQHVADTNRIGQTGVETPAVLKELTPTGPEQFGGGIPHRLVVEVQPEGGAPYEAVITQQLHQASLGHYQNSVGGPIKVKVDPQDPQKMLLWG